MKRITSILSLCILHCALCIADDEPAHSGSVARIQRRETSEAASAQNIVGELTYSIDEPGAATLRVGTSDSGTVVVSDPYAIRIAPRRRLTPGEYSVTMSPGAYIREDGAYVLAKDVTAQDGAVTNTLTIRPVQDGVKLAEVRTLIDALSGGLRRDMTEERCVLTGITKSEYNPGAIGSPGRLIVTNITVWAWAGDVRDTLLDCEATPVSFKDQLGNTSLWGLRKWVCDRYDGRTAEYWAQHPAVESVRLNGHSLLYTPGGTLRSESNDGEIAWYSGGICVMRIVGGSTTNSAELNIRAIDASGDGPVTLDVTAALGVPVRIEVCDDIKLQEWHVAPGQSSSYPSTVSVKGVNCYRVTVPLDPDADAAFYRAAATLPGGSGPGRALHLGGDETDVYVLGERAVWTPWVFTLTNNVVVTNWVLSGEAAP